MYMARLVSALYMYSMVSLLHTKSSKLKEYSYPYLCTLSRWQRRLPKEACAPARKTKGKASKSTSIKIAEEEEEAGPEEVAGLEEEEA